MKAWIDRNYINNFILYFTSVGPFLLCLLGLFLGLNQLVKNKLEFYEYLMIFYFLCFGVLVCGFIISLWIEENKTFRAIWISTEKIAGELFFGAIYVINFEDILALRPIKLNFMMKQMKLFKGEELGFDIVLKTGKTYHCSPHMEDVQGFRSELLRELKEGGYTVQT